LLPVSIHIYVSNPKTHSKIIVYLNQQLSKLLAAEVTVQDIQYLFPDGVKLSGLTINFPGDTHNALYAEWAKVRLRQYSATKRTFKLHSIKLYNPEVFFEMDSNGLNINPMIVALSGDSTSKRAESLFNISKIEIINGKYTYYNKLSKQPITSEFDADSIVVSNINLSVAELNRSRQKVITLKVNNLQCNERSGLQVNGLKMKMLISPYILQFKDFVSYVGNSELNIAHLIFQHKSFKDWGNGGFEKNVKWNFNINNSTIHTDDLAFFAPLFKGYNQYFEINTSMNGTLRNLQLPDLKLNYGINTKLNATLTLTGLPDLKKTFIFLTVNDLKSSMNDVIALNPSFFSKSQIIWTNGLRNFGNLNYKGNFTGFIDDFVSYGNLFTNNGRYTTDITISPAKKDGIYYSGRVKGEEFELNRLIENQTVGKTGFDLSIKGTIGSKNKEADLLDISGKIDYIDISKRIISNIAINGTYTNKAFRGNMYIYDPNLLMEFHGDLNFSKELPVFNFTNDIQFADLADLMIDKTDSLSQMTGKIDASFTANNRGYEGSLHLSDFSFTNSRNKISLDTVFADLQQYDKLKIQAISKMGTIDIAANTNINTLTNTLQKFLSRFSPKLAGDTANKPTSDNKFAIYARFKDIGSVFNHFIPQLDFDNDISFKASFDSKTNNAEAQLVIPTFYFQGFQGTKLNFKIKNNENRLEYTTSLKSISQGKFKRENILTKGSLINDSLLFDLSYDLIDSGKKIMSSLPGFVVFSKSKRNKAIKSDIYINESIIATAERSWKIHPTLITIDSTWINFNNLIISYNNEKIRLHGLISPLATDTLTLALENLSLNTFNFFFQRFALSIKGNINGKADIRDFYNSRLLNASIKIDSLSINNVQIGNTSAYVNWLNESKELQFKMNATRGDLKTLQAYGFYYPETFEYSIRGELNKLRMDILEPYLASFFSDIKGIATGEVSIKGKRLKAKMNGRLKIQKGSFNVDYLSTRYNFTDEFDIVDNKILLDDITLNDAEGNKANVSGYVDLSKIANINYDIRASTNRLLVLDSKPAPNSMFYGKAFGAGSYRIKGDMTAVKMTIDLSLGKGSSLVLPIVTSTSISDKYFIQYATHATANSFTTRHNNAIKNKTTAEFAIDFNLTSSPDVEIELLFENSVIDELKGYGTGNLLITYISNQRFEINGLYEILGGTFVFNLQNMINKKFAINAGSQLIWTGDPVNADVGINATYKVKTSLSNLFNDTTAAYKRRIPVDCKILLGGKLLNPEISFDFDLPSVESEVQSRVNYLLNSEEKKSRQFLSLLLFNSFVPEESVASAAPVSGSGAGFGAVSGTELLSNQLSQWLSRINSNLDIGLYYRAGTEYNTSDMELALSTELLNERVSISGNIGNQSTELNNQNTSGIAGDFEVEVKVNNTGKLRMKAFHRSNDNIVYNFNPYTQGVGVSYKHDFNKISDLFMRDTTTKIPLRSN